MNHARTIDIFGDTHGPAAGGIVGDYIFLNSFSAAREASLCGFGNCNNFDNCATLCYTAI